jgi:hypothetical protein
LGGIPVSVWTSENETAMERRKLVLQMAKAFAGERPLDPAAPDETIQRRAEEALSRVEMFLGADVEEAREIVERVREDVS